MTRWMKIGVFGMMMLLAMTPGISMTEDLGRHLLMGRLILTHGSIPATNLITHIHPDYPAIDHHWLAQVLIFAIHRVSGINGLIVWKVGMMTAALWLAMSAPCPQKWNSLYYLTGILSSVLLGSRSHIRPELFTFLFAAVFLRLFETIRKGNEKARWWIPIVLLVWVNTHIYFIFGIGMACAFSLERWMAVRSRHSFQKEALWIVSILTAGCINPCGYRGLIYPLMIFHHFGISVIEIMSPFELWNIAINPMLLGLPWISLLTIFALVQGLHLIFRRKISNPMSKEVPVDIKFHASLPIAAASLVSAWMMARNVPLLALTAPSALAVLINALPIQQEHSFERLSRMARFFSMALICGLNVWICAAIVEGSYFRRFPAPSAPSPFGFENDARFSRLSALARDFGLKGPIFNDLSIGSLVEFQLYPELAYADNRPEAFPENFWKTDYRPAFTSSNEFKALMNKKSINSVIVSTAVGQKFLYGLYTDPDWVMVHLDEICAVFVRNDGQNHRIITAKAVDSLWLDEYESDILERIDALAGLPFWKRQVETEILALRLYGLVCIGQMNRAWPLVWKLYQMFPDYDALHEIIYAGVPIEHIEQVKPLFEQRARWPLSAKHVLDWGNYLIRDGKPESARAVFHRGRLFFPFDADLQKALNQ